jgi:L-malate glycosyltransferase
VAVVAPTMAILGGHAVQARELLAGWSHDPEVEAWLVPINPVPPGPLRHALRLAGARTVATQLTYWPLLARELRRADLVHVFSASYLSFVLSPLPALIVARLFRKPVVLNYHSGEGPDHLRRSALARTVLRRTSPVAVPSPFLAEAFGSFGIDTTIVPNVVDPVRFRFRRRQNVRPNLISTRNLEPLYNVSCTLRAFQLIQRSHPEARLTVVGSGSEESKLRDLAGRLELRAVVFSGRVSPEQMHRVYAGSDIYVQTPNVDNMPLSVLEAFASGLPVVSTAVGGVPAVVTNEVNGLLAAADDHAGVARQVNRLLEEDGLAARLSAAAREACEQFTWHAVRDGWLDLYRAAIAGSTGTPAMASS